MRLIGLNGRLHCGKDTAVQYIREAAPNLRVERIGFADKMKLSGVRALGFDPVDMEQALLIANLIKEHGTVTITGVDEFYNGFTGTISGRQFWQRYGTEAHREVYGDEFHVDALLPRPSDHPSEGVQAVTSKQKLQRAFPDVDVLLITDVRFPNEARRIRALGGEVWYIEADKRLGPLPPGSHISEHPLPDDLVSVTIHNNTSLENYETAVKLTWELGPRDR